jgi:hypothetical protein
MFSVSFRNVGREKSSVTTDYYVNNTVVFETPLFYNGAD